jgi:hypothetical protein
MSNDGDKNKDSRIISTILCLILVGAGAYGLATDDLGWTGIILGGAGLAYIAITGKS